MEKKIIKPKEPTADRKFELEIKAHKGKKVFADCQLVDGNPFQAMQAMSQNIEMVKKKVMAQGIELKEPKWFVGEITRMFVGFVIVEKKVLDKGIIK